MFYEPYSTAKVIQDDKGKEEARDNATEYDVRLKEEEGGSILGSILSNRVKRDGGSQLVPNSFMGPFSMVLAQSGILKRMLKVIKRTDLNNAIGPPILLLNLHNLFNQMPFTFLSTTTYQPEKKAHFRSSVLFYSGLSSVSFL